MDEVRTYSREELEERSWAFETANEPDLADATITADTVYLGMVGYGFDKERVVGTLDPGDNYDQGFADGQTYILEQQADATITSDTVMLGEVGYGAGNTRVVGTAEIEPPFVWPDDPRSIHYWFTLNEALTGLQIVLVGAKPASMTFMIYWGDGTSEEWGTLGASHTYAAGGDYEIVIKNTTDPSSSDVFTMQSPFLRGVSSPPLTPNNTDSDLLTRVYVNDPQVAINNITSCYTIREIYIDRRNGNRTAGFAQTCYSMRRAIYSAYVGSYGGSVWGSLYRQPLDIVFRAVVPPLISTSTFYNSSSGYKAPGMRILVPRESVQAYKTATNWVIWADYIYPEV